MISDLLAEKIGKARIIATLTVDDPARAEPLAQALIEGGISAIELTLRTEKALEAMRVIARKFPAMIVGAGTVITPDQVKAVQDAGAIFAVAPGFNPMVVKAADDLGLPFAPGVMTPSDIEGAIALGCKILKFYHAEVIGGLKAMKAIAVPYEYLGLRFIPLGGIDQENLAEWSSDPLVLAVGGSWIAPRSLIANGDWNAITARASAAMAVAEKSEKENQQ